MFSILNMFLVNEIKVILKEVSLCMSYLRMIATFEYTKGSG